MKIQLTSRSSIYTRNYPNLKNPYVWFFRTWMDAGYAKWIKIVMDILYNEVSLLISEVEDRLLFVNFKKKRTMSTTMTKKKKKRISNDINIHSNVVVPIPRRLSIVQKTRRKNRPKSKPMTTHLLRDLLCI